MRVMNKVPNIENIESFGKRKNIVYPTNIRFFPTSDPI